MVEARPDVSQVIRSVENDKTFEKRTISGLPLWAAPDFALARVGPKTLAVGSEPEVEELARVRLGIKPDLKTTGPLFDRLQSLNQASSIRLVSLAPAKLAQMFDPVFAPELIDTSELLGLSLTLQNPVKARLSLKMKSAPEAADLAGRIKNDPRRWLRMPGADLLLYAQTPEVDAQCTNLQVRFDIPENSARLLLQRLAKTNPPPPPVAGN